MNNCDLNECCNFSADDKTPEILYNQLFKEICNLAKTTEANQLLQDKKIAELCLYIKNNLSNTLLELVADMKHSGELDHLITTTVLNSLKSALYDIADLKNQTISYITPEIYGGAGDGATDETEILKSALAENKAIHLRDKSYVISETLSLNSVIQNGTIIYTGAADKPIFEFDDRGGLRDVNIIIKTANYQSAVIYVDYTKYSEQFNPLKFELSNVYIDNTITNEFIPGSAILKINYDKYKVIYAQNITGLRFDGKMDYGIYIEPILRDTNDNPVFNTSKFENIFFNSVNCAIKVLPIIKSGAELENARGGVGLLLQNFANQHTNGINKPFLDLHNTNIEGVMVIPWDYWGENIPDCGIYKCINSHVLLNKDYFNSNSHDSGVKFLYTVTSMNEVFSNLNTIKVEEVGDRAPVRSTGIAWGIDNVKMVVFTPEENNPYKQSYIGFEIQPSNKRYSNNPTIQFGFSGNGVPYFRKFDGSTKKWGELRRIYTEGGCPQSYAGKRPDGIAVGDMKFDTTKNKPVWWNGSAWILADGTSI